jgi:hypothetical protein
MRAGAVILLVLFLSPFSGGRLYGQENWLLRYGVDVSLPQYNVTQYAPANIFFNDLGLVFLPQRTMKSMNWYCDLDAWFQLKKRNFSLKFNLGLFDKRLKLDSQLLSPAGTTFYDAYARENGLRAGAMAGYRLFGHRALQLYLSAGFQANLFSMSADPNPINWLFKLADQVATDNSTTTRAADYYLNKQYFIPPIALVSAIDLDLYRSTFSIVSEYRNPSIRIGDEGKPPLYKYNLLFKLQWAFVLGYRYKK